MTLVVGRQRDARNKVTSMPPAAGNGRRAIDPKPKN
jgi:hypothetical protein